MPSIENWNPNYDWSNETRDQNGGGEFGAPENVLAPSDWRYGYIQSSAPGLRKPSENYGEDWLTPVLRAYPGISSGAISEMAKVPVYSANLSPYTAGQYMPTPFNPSIELNSQFNSPDYGKPSIALHEYAHALSADHPTWNPFDPWWGEFDRAVRGVPQYQYAGEYAHKNPQEAYAEMARIYNARREDLPRPIQRFYWWLR